MRTLVISITSVICNCLFMFAHAEQHMFVVANDPDGYGIDRCLASGEKCGAAAANAYCKIQAFNGAAGFHRVSRADVTGSITEASAGVCAQGDCELVAIVCTR